MIINQDKKIVLLQNPKTGGRFRANSLSQGFKRYEIIDFICNGNPYKTVFPFHLTCTELQKYLGDEWDIYHKYTVIRNPYNRFVSAVNFRFRSVLRETSIPDLDRALDIVESNPNILQLQSNTIWFCPQCNWVGEGVKILRYESVDDWIFLCDMLGICKESIRIRSDYNLTEEQKRRIRQLYKDDEFIFNFYENTKKD